MLKTIGLGGRVALGLGVLLGLGMFANGVVMLWDPYAWYGAVPGVPQTGPFNQHFIRDIGIMYLLIGAAYAGGVLSVHRTALWTAATLWLGAHALFHFWEVAVGICGTDALARDFTGVTLPPLLGAALIAWSLTAGRQSAR
jgi:hypothetical protein